jgi:hypothetical protein
LGSPLKKLKKNPPKAIQMAILCPKIYSFGLRDTDVVKRNDIFNI